MSTRKRKGMIIKNTHARPVTVDMATRTIVVRPGDEIPITAEEVRDSALRQYLQVRAISIVRPTSDEEEAALKQQLDAERRARIEEDLAQHDPED